MRFVLTATIVLCSLATWAAAQDTAPADPAAAATTPAAAETRQSYRIIKVKAPDGIPSIYELVPSILQKRVKELAPEFNLAPKAAAEALGIQTYPGGGETTFAPWLTLPPPARPASKEMMDRVLAGLPDELRKLRQQGADESLKHLRAKKEALAARGEQAAARIKDQRKQAQELTGQIEPDARRMREAAGKLEDEQQRLELDLLGKTARREAMEEQIAEQSAAIEKKVADDAIVAELAKVVEAHEKRVERIRALVKQNAASTTEVAEMIGNAAESRAKLLQRKREAMMESGGDILQNFNRELLTLSVDVRELRARLDAIGKRLGNLGEATSKLDEAVKAENEAGEIRNEMQALEQRLAEAEKFTPRAGEIKVTLREKSDELEIRKDEGEPLN